MQLMRNQRNSTRKWQIPTKNGHFVALHLLLITIKFFCVSNSYLNVTVDRFSHQPDRKLRLGRDFFDLGKRLSFLLESAIKISWHPHHPIPLLRLWVSEWESTRMKRERLLELCSAQMIITARQIMSSCKERMILLFNSTSLQGDGHFVEKFFNFERRVIRGLSTLRLWGAKIE